MSAFDDWSYDALARASLQFGEYIVSIERTGEIWWVTFDGGPGCWCSEGIVQGFEELAATGPPVDLGAKAARSVADYLDAARQPGRSTYVVRLTPRYDCGGAARLARGAR